MVKFIFSLLSDFGFLSHSFSCLQRKVSFHVRKGHKPEETGTIIVSADLLWALTKDTWAAILFFSMFSDSWKWRQNQDFLPLEAQRASPMLVKMNSQ